MPGVEVRGLTKRFGGVGAVDGVTFGVEPGRVTGFLGPNGAGKGAAAVLMAYAAIVATAALSATVRRDVT
jgi:ABC-type multidrug transport system ATPase subunit